MSELSVNVDDIVDTEHFASRIADDIEERLTTLTVSVANLVDGNWVGVAANSFVEEWEQWRAGVRSVLEGIAHTRRQLLETAQAYSSQEECNSASIESTGNTTTQYLTF